MIASASDCCCCWPRAAFAASRCCARLALTRCSQAAKFFVLALNVLSVCFITSRRCHSRRSPAGTYSQHFRSQRQQDTTRVGMRDHSWMQLKPLANLTHRPGQADTRSSNNCTRRVMHYLLVPASLATLPCVFVRRRSCSTATHTINNSLPTHLLMPGTQSAAAGLLRP